MSEVLTNNWAGCYREGWGMRLRPASYAHPAKNSYGLSVRIYEHALAEGWIKAGDYVVDCFSGVGGFALEAMRHGLHFRGVELEQRFVDMGQGCDCSGISKADWVRYQGRWDRMRYKDGRHWCPECLAEAKEIEHDRGQLRMFARAPSSSYVRNSGKIPCTGAHRYHGNIETWEAQGMPGTAVIVQGDSRRLGEVLAQASLCLSSPPYANSIHGSGADAARKRIAEGRYKGLRPDVWTSPGNIAGSTYGDGYSADPANLGNLPDTGFEACLCSPGRQAALMLGSPPYSPHGVGHDAGYPRLDATEDKRRNEEGSGRRPAYGSEPGQLAQMLEGDLALALGSPPYIDAGTHQPGSDIDKREMVLSREKRKTPGGRMGVSQLSGYGTSDGQLAALPEGSHAEACERPTCCVSSPPWQSSLQASAGIDKEARKQAAARLGITQEQITPCDVNPTQTSYGSEAGQLGQMPPGDHAEALEAGAVTGRAQACISSPPWEASLTSKDEDFLNRKFPNGNQALDAAAGYGSSAGQLGQETGSTFWAASRQILGQVYQVLAPGGHAIFVCKRFVRNKTIVDFPLQWARLCEAVGFKWIHHHKAWLVEDRGAQHTLEGGLEKREVRRLSFFRRLHMQKYPHLAILWEDVLCFVKE